MSLLSNARSKNFYLLLSTLIFITYVVFVFVRFVNADFIVFEDIILYSKAISNLLVFNCFFMLFGLKNKTIHFVLVLLSATFLGHYEFFESALFDFLVPRFFELSNPQYPRLIFSISVLFLSTLYLFKKPSFTNLFSIMGLLVVIVTSWIFHVTIVTNNLETYKKANGDTLHSLINIDDPALVEVCTQRNYYCYKKNPEGITTLNLVNNYKEVLDELGFSRGLGLKFKSHFFTKPLLNYNPINLQQLTYSRNGHEYMIVDIYSFENHKKELVKLFYFLSFCAHSFWSLFILYLMFLHRNKVFHFKKLYT